MIRITTAVASALRAGSLTITGKDVELGWRGALLGWWLDEGGGVGPELLHHHHRLLRVHCRGGLVHRRRLGTGTVSRDCLGTAVQDPGPLKVKERAVSNFVQNF
jgi:hypothetical protein